MRVLALALEGLEARAKNGGGLDGEELSEQVRPLVALADDIEAATQYDRRGRARMAAAASRSALRPSTPARGARPA